MRARPEACYKHQWYWGYQNLGRLTNTKGQEQRWMDNLFYTWQRVFFKNLIEEDLFLTLQISYVTLDKVCLYTGFFYPLFPSNPIIIKHCFFSFIGNMATPWLWLSYPVVADLVSLRIPLTDFNDIWLIYHLPPLTFHCHFQSQIRYLDNKGRCSVYTKP